MSGSVFGTISWFTQFAHLYTHRNEIVDGGIVTSGAAVAHNNMQLDVTELKCTLDGKMKAALAADDDVNYLAKAGTVGQPIYQDGADATGFSLVDDSEDVAYVTLIVCDSKGDGDPDTDDNGNAVVVAIIAGEAAGDDKWNTKTAHLTTAEIQAALSAAAGIHAGVVGWAHLAQVVFDENDQAPTVTITMNRNNVLGA